MSYNEFQKAAELNAIITKNGVGEYMSKQDESKKKNFC